MKIDLPNIQNFQTPYFFGRAQVWYYGFTYFRVCAIDTVSSTPWFCNFWENAVLASLIGQKCRGRSFPVYLNMDFLNAFFPAAVGRHRSMNGQFFSCFFVVVVDFHGTNFLEGITLLSEIIVGDQPPCIFISLLEGVTPPSEIIVRGEPPTYYLDQIGISPL